MAIVEYEGGDRLNVPLYRLDQVERYRAAGEGTATRRRRGSTGWAASWARVREKTRHAIKQMAAELLELYAQRTVTGGYAFPPDSVAAGARSSFLYEDTPDQRKATEEVKADMERPRPMDRLLVGDVGYGKTEIAVRAAFKAVQGGKQVAVLVPTTILAEQHGRTFIERLADFPVTIEVLSRFRTAKEQRAALERLAAGQIDVIIGTHRLLSKDVLFKDLGLLVVDEEHRFGVKHKERLKAAPALGGRADAHRHADPPDAPSLPRRPPRPHPDRDASARPLADPDLRGAVGRCACSRRRSPGRTTAAGRSSWSTTGSRRSTRSRPRCSRSRRAPGSAWPTGRWRRRSSRR